jgi:hypothetical protein
VFAGLFEMCISGFPLEGLELAVSMPNQISESGGEQVPSLFEMPSGCGDDHHLSRRDCVAMRVLGLG